MTATTASDPSGVEYYFDCTAGAGGHDSVWQASPTYQDTGLSASTQYSYRVQARDLSANHNTGSWSTTQSATTDTAGTEVPVFNSGTFYTPWYGDTDTGNIPFDLATTPDGQSTPAAWAQRVDAGWTEIRATGQTNIGSRTYLEFDCYWNTDVEPGTSLSAMHMEVNGDGGWTFKWEGTSVCWVNGNQQTFNPNPTFAAKTWQHFKLDLTTNVQGGTWPANPNVGVIRIYQANTGGSSLYLNNVEFTDGGTLPPTTLLTDGFETDFNKWTDGGATDWDRATDQKHTATYSAHAGSADNDLISDNLNSAGYSSITIDFWYRDDDIDDADDIYLQLYNGSAYANRLELGNSTEDTWQHATVTVNNSGGDAAYFISNFRIKFEGTSIDSGENLWIDDVVVTVQGTGGGSTPVGWWKLNETSGTAAADDGTGNNDGTVSGATWASGHINNALSFDGVDDVVDILTETDVTDLPSADFSVAFWMNWNRDAAQQFDTILGKYGHNGTTTAGWELSLDQVNSRLTFSILFATTDMLYRSSNSSIPANSWVHIACVYTASTKTAKIYVGGTEPGYATQTAGAGTYDTDSTIRTQLGRAYWSSNYYRGLLDDVRFYDYALSGTEVATLAAQ
jgi:hypothetical protein